MKNIVIIDVDTSREQPIRLGKPSDVVIPQTEEGQLAMATEDIQSIVTALNYILTATSNDHLRAEIIDYLAPKEMYVDQPEVEDQEEPQTNTNDQ